MPAPEMDRVLGPGLAWREWHLQASLVGCGSLQVRAHRPLNGRVYPGAAGLQGGAAVGAGALQGLDCPNVKASCGLGGDGL